jgi:hypothetical protein
VTATFWLLKGVTFTHWALLPPLPGRPPTLRCPPRRRGLKPPSPTAPVQQTYRPTAPLPVDRPALRRTQGVSASSPARGLTFNFVRCLRRGKREHPEHPRSERTRGAEAPLLHEITGSMRPTSARARRS